MKISQRAAKISVAFNFILVIVCFALLIYANFQRTYAEHQQMVAIEQRNIADSVMTVAIEQREMAISAMELAERRRWQADSAAAAARRAME